MIRLPCQVQTCGDRVLWDLVTRRGGVGTLRPGGDKTESCGKWSDTPCTPGLHQGCTLHQDCTRAAPFTRTALGLHKDSTTIQELLPGSRFASICYLLAHATACWHLLQPAGICYNKLASAITLWHLLHPAGTCYNPLAPATTLWHLLQPAGICYNLLASATTHRHLLHLRTACGCVMVGNAHAPLTTFMKQNAHAATDS
eukprot:364719-Chlamydomonas_euryale.AAC.2